MRAALSLRNEIAELPRLVAFATEFAKRNELPTDELNRLLVIVDELFSNVVQHGYEAPEASGTVEVGLSYAGGCLGIEVTDDGRPFDPLSAPPPDLDLPAEDRPIGGLGIHFVKKLVDEAQYSRRGRRNRLLLMRRIQPTTASPLGCCGD
jgi:anti-sigma regulatory factor (Ser/Thr protein kinase)